MYGTNTATGTKGSIGGLYGAYGEHTLGGFGVKGFASGGPSSVGGYFFGDGGPSSSGINAGSPGGTGVYVGTSGTYSGYFAGYLYAGSVSGSIKAFRIDHPLDPENKYLQHSSVESPDMMNVYNGNATLDKSGEAWIELPNYFETLNKDFRYQLTCIGEPAVLYVKQKIKENRFLIAGGKPGMEVSWQVTGIRQDPVANLHRVRVEVNKPENERGRYLMPEAYGQPADRAVNYHAMPELSKGKG